jgi:hypothetical protein
VDCRPLGATDKNKQDHQSNMGTGVALGAASGFIFGLLVLDNLGLGLGLGVMIGIVISAIADAQAAKRK